MDLYYFIIAVHVSHNPSVLLVCVLLIFIVLLEDLEKYLKLLIKRGKIRS